MEVKYDERQEKFIGDADSYGREDAQLSEIVIHQLRKLTRNSAAAINKAVRFIKQKGLDLSLLKMHEQQIGLFGSSIPEESEEKMTNLRNLSIKEENEKKGIKTLNYTENAQLSGMRKKFENIKMFEIPFTNSYDEKLHLCEMCGICDLLCVLTAERNRTFVSTYRGKAAQLRLLLIIDFN
ncbi:hypothetical protein X798_06703 [Onchocerca flexuosa]|uniref:Uncharacterized protein n=1 Tax=Onchocerca flexuosa TaxID=387005 RepID=A0A238BLI8_9BILA|nr:hypothetical protein X798_06703 [Onchocerca flexuosa]